MPHPHFASLSRRRRASTEPRVQARRFLIVLPVLAGFAVSPPAQACSLSLVLAMDGSASVDAREHALQLNGLADALRDPATVDAIEAVGGIWITSFEWSGRDQQLLQLGWSYLSDEASAATAAETLRRSPRGFTEFPTALGYALAYAARQMAEAPENCSRKVVDVAGDGINNDGFGPESAYRTYDFSEVTVNGLVISGPNDIPVQYFRTHVIRGPGAFIEVAATYDDYAEAMKRKLLREISGSGYAALR
jgi:hypothetical protein